MPKKTQAPETPAKSKAGRPRLEIDKEQLEALCRLNPTLKDTAAFFKCSQATIDRYCKEFGYNDFEDCRQKNMVHTRLNVVRKALKMVEDGNPAMVIFALKNLCNWSDRTEMMIDANLNVKVMTDYELKKLVRRYVELEAPPLERDVTDEQSQDSDIPHDEHEESVQE